LPSGRSTDRRNRRVFDEEENSRIERRDFEEEEKKSEESL
jgi:hypothetical protein